MPNDGPYIDSLDLRAQLERIDRMHEEAIKLYLQRQEFGTKNRLTPFQLVAASMTAGGHWSASPRV